MLKVNKHNDHPDRAALLAAVAKPTEAINRHLESCDTCRFLYSLLQAPSPGPETSQVFSEAVYSSAALAARERARHPAARLSGNIGYDSWKHLATTAVRDQTGDQERRLTLTAGDYSLEIVAERVRSHWLFTARLYCGQEPQRHFILEVGRRKLHAQSRRCYFWQTKTPPRRLAISSGDVRIDFGDIPW